ncbi:MAG: radical SAM protein, partial [Deltaproteobacteria bacterium]|nr:radical SAM protein [Deltaproteobacteria bacterium]
RAYQIADAYRKKGIRVVLGGIHPTAVPDEAAEHADAVVIGEAEQSWPQLLKDFQRGNLKAFYRQNRLTDLSTLPVPRRDIHGSKGYFPLGVVQATRGCPYRCEFCSVRTFFGDTFRLRPLNDVISEVKGMRHKLLMFNDDNIIGHPGYSRELLQAITPLKKKWMGQASLAGLRDEKTIRLMAQSGCIGLLIGFESIIEKNITSIGKLQNRPSHYMEVINSLHRNGIAIWASFIFGFDYDDPTVFERTVEFAIKAKIFSAVFAMLTPYPGTELYNRMKAEGRLTDEKWWLREGQQDRAPHFEPMGMSRRQLREGWKWAWKEFYSLGSIIRRFQSEFPPTLVNRLIYFPFGLMQNRFTRKKILQGKRRYRTKFPSL